MLIKLMLRGMKKNWLQFISVMLMAFLGIYLYTGVNASWYSLQAIQDTYYSETNMADLWVYGSFDENDYQKIMEIGSVKEVDKRVVLHAIVEQKEDTVIEMNFVDSIDVSQCKIKSGTDYFEEDGVWLDYDYAVENGIEVGDQVVFKLDYCEITATVKALVLNPDYIYQLKDSSSYSPDHKSFGFAFMPEGALWREVELDEFYTCFVMDVEDDANINQISDSIKETLDGKYSAVQTRETHLSSSTLQSEIDSFKGVGAIFPVLFMGISFMLIITTLTRMVNKQRTQIGTFKALGLSKAKIIWYYLSYGFYPTLVGCLLGLVLGPYTFPGAIFTSYNTGYFCLPNWDVSTPEVSFTWVIICVVGSTFICYFPCRKVLNESAASALRLKEAKKQKVSKFEQTEFWEKRKFKFKWIFKEMKNSKMRTFMALFGTMACGLLLVCAFGMKDSIDNIFDWYFTGLQTYEVKATASYGATEELMQNVADENGGSLYMEQPVEMKRPDSSSVEAASLKVIDGNVISYEDADGNSVNLGTVGISNKMAQKLELKVGDRFEWRLSGETTWQESVVEIIYRTPFDQGMTVTKKYYMDKDMDYTPTSILFPEELTDEEIERIEGNDFIGYVQKKSELREEMVEFMSAMYSIVYVLIILAVILNIVVLYNIGVLSFTERYRELATLKAQGFSDKLLRGLLFGQNMWLSAIGLIVGMCLGTQMIGLMFSATDAYDFNIVVKPLSIFLSIVLTYGTSVLVSLLFNRRLKNLDLVGTFKNND
jgi:putative ABC transport system permease protein